MDSVSRLTNQISERYTIRQQQQGPGLSIQDKLKEDGQQLNQAGLAGMRIPSLVEKTNESGPLSNGERLQSTMERSEQEQEEAFSLSDFGPEPEKGQQIDLLV